jgi:hypothetical protein
MLWLSALVLAGAATAADSRVSKPVSPPLLTENVVLIVPDGVRWQEVFTGAEKALLNDREGGSWLDEPTLLLNFWRDDTAERRKLLFPFLWGTVARQGQIFGNKALGSSAHVTNPHAFSYPGYNELLAGFGDPRIDSNEYGPNPNLTVFEWLNAQPDLHGRVAAFATWGTFHDIFNQPRSGMHVVAGPRLKTGTLTPRDEWLNEMIATTTMLDANDLYNSFTQVAAVDYIKQAGPRVLFIGYGETDSWSHSGRYDLVLTAAHQVDRFIEQLWNTMQSMPQYRGKTTFIITTDHGRGNGPVDWKEHGTPDSPGSEDIWIAVLGPDTPALGERRDVPAVTQAQVAATIAAFLGRDFRKAAPQAAAPLPDVIAPAAHP